MSASAQGLDIDVLAAVSRSLEAHNGSRDGDRAPYRAAAEGVRGLKHQLGEVRSFRATLAAYAADRSGAPALPPR